MSEESNAGRIVGIIVLVIVLLGAAGGGYYWFVYKPKQEAIERARLEQEAAEEAERKRQEEEARKRAEYDQLIIQADSVFALEDWETAQTLYTRATSILPDESYARDQLSMVNGQLQEIESRRLRIQEGIIDMITSRTGRYFAIVSSSIDDDLAMDYAKKLAREGNDVKIIEHNSSSHVYYRVALGDYVAREEAEADLSSYYGYGDSVWVLRF